MRLYTRNQIAYEAAVTMLESHRRAAVIHPTEKIYLVHVHGTDHKTGRSRSFWDGEEWNQTIGRGSSRHL